MVLAILAYGLVIPWLGFYWDDWPLVWYAHHLGADVYQDFAAYRPASGWIYYFSFLFVGYSPLAWQVYALLARWLSALAFWWLLKLLWPKGGKAVTAMALLFLLYPGFAQQSISVTYSVYFLYYASFLASLSLMILALRAKERKLFYIAGSIVLALVTMLSTEYFYGLELLRPLILWFALPPGKARIRGALRAWLPYAALVPVVFAWRYLATQQDDALYGTGLLSAIAANPMGATVEWLGIAVTDIFEAGALAWLRVGEVWGQIASGSRVALLYFPVAIIGVAVAIFALRQQKSAAKGYKALGRQAIGLGLVALAVAGISFWVAQLPLRLELSFDRFTLPMMFGASLVLGGGWALLRAPDRVKIGLLALLLGLCVGLHFLTGNRYRLEWERQVEFFQQLAWRAPALAPGTVVISPELRTFVHYSDNSLTGPLNWMYTDPQPGSSALSYDFLYADLRAGAGLQNLAEGGRIRDGYIFVDYQGGPENVLLLIYEPPGCLRVLDPRLDENYPQLPAEVADLLHFSHPELITVEPDLVNERMPFWSVEWRETWCYYFEKADLARQLGDWEQVVALGDVAYALEDDPNHPAEHTPFIEGYAMLGELDRALKLAEQAVKDNPLMQPMLCDLWLRISKANPSALAAANDVLDCAE